MAVKDVFQLKGEKNTAGSPQWFCTHPVATKTAHSLSRLLQAGATFIGFTHLDELAYSMQGNNMHYGAADNPRLPGYFCGGSSMGSAAAVASGLANIALGTDTGGSVRVPASYCGLFGIRTSHALISLEGVIGLAPCFDTVGWFSQNASLLFDVVKLLIPKQDRTTREITQLIICPEINQLADKPIQAILNQYITTLRSQFKMDTIVHLPDQQILHELSDVFRILQGRAIANEHGVWIKKYRPIFSADIAERISMALSITDMEVSWPRQKQRYWYQYMANWLPDRETVLVIPTSVSTALKKNTHLSTRALSLSRQRLLGLTAIARLEL
ncbi:amidase family protein [Microbulbifer sp. OS29]|uniref:Amidase family protein n=1 Tax=Microbulbifer okhotskensis TaxID=2926617 RepID=A0A9X2J6V3_9GAMM|nr:amidase family protein [Microbulbifer okhotskensis]